MIKNKENKQPNSGRKHGKHKLFMWVSLSVFIVQGLFVSLGKKITRSFSPQDTEVSPVSGGVSSVLHAVFAVVTLEGPRLMLISRYRAARMKRGTKVGISATGVTALASIIVASVLIGSQLTAVIVDGKVIGYVEDEGQYSTLLQRAKDKVSEQVGTEGTEILIDEKNVSLETVIAPQQEPMTVVAPASEASDGGQAASGDVGNDRADTAIADIPVLTGAAEDGSTPPEVNAPAPVVDPEADAATVPDSGTVDSAEDAEAGDSAVPAEAQAGEEALVNSLIDSLIDDSAIKATVHTITVNGNEMATLATLKEASDVLQTIADKFSPEDGVEEGIAGKFMEDVAINSVTTELDKVNLQSAEDVANYLLTGTTDERSYTAVEKDSLENVCAMLGINEAKLRTEYPEYNFNVIKEGDIFTTTLQLPYVNYQTEATELSNEPVPFETIEEKTDTLFLGQREIKEEGVLGERNVTRFVVRVNGEIVRSEEVTSEILKEPVAETMLVGTKMVFMGEGSAYVGPSDGYGGGGGGPLGRPLNSWYLSRSVGNGHYGADMLAEQGTPIFAADTGTVTFVGVWGGYGNLVIIDHGNGMQTYYAHCDSFNTTEGTRVERGQQIATVGSTGRSTAFHLHFEVRINGEVHEPLDWIG